MRETAGTKIETLRDALIQVEALCHTETRQKLLAICHDALEKVDGKNWRGEAL